LRLRSITGEGGQARPQHGLDQQFVCGGGPGRVFTQGRAPRDFRRERCRAAYGAEAAPHQLPDFVADARVHRRAGRKFGARLYTAARAREQGSQPPAEDDGFQQRVAREPVRAVQAGVRDLTDCPQLRHARAAVEIHCDAAHVVVRGTGHGDRLAKRIDAVFLAVSPGRRKRLGEFHPAQRRRIEPDAPARHLLRMHDGGHDVARREIAERMRGFHDAPSALVDQVRAGAAHGFGDEWQGTRLDIECRGMELNRRELRAARAGGERHRQAIASRHRGVGRAAVQRADATGRKDHVTGMHRDLLALGGYCRHPARASPVAEQGERVHARQPFDVRRGCGCIAQRVHDDRARGVAAGMQHARPAVRGLEVQRPRRVAARKAHTLRFEPGHGRRCALAGELHRARVVE